MKIIQYEDQFNTNEWFILISVIVGILLILLLPKRFTKQTTCVFFMCGVFSGFLFDHTLSVLPFSYFFFYLYDRFTIKPRFLLLWILGWALLSVGIETICERIGVFHYENGYKIYYSFLIYLMVVSLWVLFYKVISIYGDNQY